MFSRRAAVLALVVLAVFVVLAWRLLPRYELVESGSGPVVYRLDRWTGEVAITLRDRSGRWALRPVDFWVYPAPERTDQDLLDILDRVQSGQ